MRQVQRTTDEYRCFSIRGWQPKGWLQNRMVIHLGWKDWRGDPDGQMEVIVRDDTLWLHYGIVGRGDQVTEMFEPVQLSYTPCNLGGKRAWMVCAGQGCQRRVSALYLSGGRFHCRHCLGLTYASCREPWYDRAHRKADRIRVKLKWEQGVWRRGEGRPRYMHFRTYIRLIDRYAELMSAGFKGMMWAYG